MNGRDRAETRALVRKFAPSGGGGGPVAIGDVTGLTAALDAKQDELVSGTNIKTVNGQDIVGSGDVTISGGGASAASKWVI